MVALFFISAAFTTTQAQTTADSALVVTDTSVTTSSNIVVTDSSGSTTLFAGGQQSGYNGKVGIGTSSPTSKLTIYDDTKASLRISQPYTPTAAASNIRTSNQTSPTNNGGTTHHGAMQAVMGSNNQPISNFDIDILDAPTGDGIFPQGTVIQSTPTDGAAPFSAAELTCSTTMNDEIINMAGLPDQPPCNIVDWNPMIYKSTSYGWYTPRCPGPDFKLAMYLATSPLFNTPFLAVDARAFFNMDVHVKGNFQVEDNTGHQLLYLKQADQTLYARGIKVQTTNFPDFVFDNSYKLMGIKELESYINQNHHLPELPTACEAETDGVNVGDMQNKLLQKIEELTLYMVQQQKEIEELKAQVANTKH